MIEHDWVHRQVHLYDLGGLRHFLGSVAGPGLVAGADRIDEWASAPMGGYQLVRSAPPTLVWHDLATGVEVLTADLGAGTFFGDGDCAIGRLVPIEDEAFVRMLLAGLHDYELVSDVPDVMWRSNWFAGLLSDDPREIVAEGAAFVGLVAATTHGSGLHGSPGSDWLGPLVAAALVVPGVAAEVERLTALLPHLAGDTDWNRVADVLPEPAASLTRGLATQLREAS